MSAMQAIMRTGAEFFKQGLKAPTEIRVSNGTFALLDFELSEMVRTRSNATTSITLYIVGGEIKVLPETEL